MCPARKIEEVQLREAKANLSSLTKLARDGACVVITNHGIPIADLVAHGKTAPSILKLKKPGPAPKAIRLAGSGPSASDVVLRDREG